MSNGDTAGTPDPLSPDQAFAVLSNKTRIHTLQALADADGPVSFTELRNRVGLRQGSQFNYHLTKLVGHFVAKTDAGYELLPPGKRVVNAVLAGAVDAGPELEPTPIDYDCHFCTAPVAVQYTAGYFILTCTECPGHRITESEVELDHEPDGYLATVEFPPAGVAGRSPMELFRSASTWAHLNGLAVSSGVCPRCAARVEPGIDACPRHDASDGTCPRCDRRLAIRATFDCTNCTYEFEGPTLMAVLDEPAILAFAGRHGFNLTSTGIDWGWDWEEVVLDTDPFRGRLVITIDDDTLTLEIDETLRAVHVE